MAARTWSGRVMSSSPRPGAAMSWPGLLRSRSLPSWPVDPIRSMRIGRIIAGGRSQSLRSRWRPARSVRPTSLRDLRQSGPGEGLPGPGGAARPGRLVPRLRHAERIRRQGAERAGCALARPRAMGTPGRRAAGKAALGGIEAAFLGAARPLRCGRPQILHVLLGRTGQRQGKMPGRRDCGRARRSLRRLGQPHALRPGLRAHRSHGLRRPAHGARLLYWGSGFKAIQVQELAPDRLQFLPGSPPRELLVPDAQAPYRSLIEGAWMHYRAGAYYLFHSGDRCCRPEPRYAVFVARATNPLGPFELLPQPILEKTTPGSRPAITASRPTTPAATGCSTTRSARRRRVSCLLDHIEYRDGWPRSPAAGPRR